MRYLNKGKNGNEPKKMVEPKKDPKMEFIKKLKEGKKTKPTATKSKGFKTKKCECGCKNPLKLHKEGGKISTVCSCCGMKH